MPSTPIVVVQDTREKIPLLFPATINYHGRLREVSVVKRTMPEGDYTLDGCEELVLVERKGGIKELHANLLTKDKARFHDAFDRLCEATEQPILLLEGTASQFRRATVEIPHPDRILQLLFDLCDTEGVDIMLLGAGRSAARRRDVGLIVLRRMLSACFPHI